MQDPLADGPTIQAAHSKGLETGTTVDKVLLQQNLQELTPQTYTSCEGNEVDIVQCSPATVFALTTKEDSQWRVHANFTLSKSLHYLAGSGLSQARVQSDQSPYSPVPVLQSSPSKRS